MTAELFLNAIVAGILLGGFYAALTVGISLSFGILDIVNIAHPAFIVVGAYAAYALYAAFGLDPIVASIVLSPLFFILGAVIYQAYHFSFEQRGQDAMRGLAFFFGILMVVEVALILAFGVDYRYVQTSYTETTFQLGILTFPLRMVVPFFVAMMMVGGLIIYMSRSFTGRLIMAVSQDATALRLLAANPVKIKRAAFALSIATASVAGGLLIAIQPIEPAMGREYIGRIFAICVLGGLQSLSGMVIGAILLGIMESMTATFFGPSWSPAVSFGFLLFALAFKPSGLLSR